MRYFDYISGTFVGWLKRIVNLETRMNSRECFTKLKSYTTTEMNAIENPEAGYLIWNTTVPAVYVYTGSAWAKTSSL